MKNLLKLFVAVLLIASCSKKEEKANLVILTDNGDVVYDVENAQTPEQLEKGLMFREKLAPNAGMMFDLSHSDAVAMWMKNTKISLDMVFMDKDGNVIWVFENAEPESTNLIIVPEATKAVLEVNAGDIVKHNIKVGNVVKHKFFDNMKKEIKEPAPMTEVTPEEVQPEPEVVPAEEPAPEVAPEPLKD